MKDGNPIMEMQLPQTIDAGITIESADGFVPEYEAREAAKYSGYTYKEWKEIHYMERAQAVAHYRLHYRVEAFVSRATESYHNRKRS